MRIFFAVIFLTVANFAYADASPPTNADPTWLVEARVSIKSGKFEQAIQQLQSSNQTSSAEWNNLMGFSLRQQSKPDLLNAENYYKFALRIDPKHKGSLEYYGMLKLTQNDLPGAEELVARLNKICFFGCEEYADLKEAIKKYKSKN